MDGTMCLDFECPSAATCLRSKLSGTKPEKGQKFWAHGSARGAADDCVYYIQVKGKAHQALLLKRTHL